MREQNCKGSWQLGTACKVCEKCIQEAGNLIPQLMQERNQLVNTIGLSKTMTGTKLAGSVDGPQPVIVRVVDTDEEFMIHAVAVTSKGYELLVGRYEFVDGKLLFT